MQYDLAIAIGAEHIARRLQFLAQLEKIIDFAIEAERQRLVFGVHRLRTTTKINDRQAPMAKPDTGRGPHAGAIRPAVRNRIGHPLHPVRVNRLGRLQVKNTRNAAHY